jgi:hypothetical protein
MTHAKFFFFFFNPCIEIFFILENYLNEKFVWIEKLLALKKSKSEKYLY